MLTISSGSGYVIRMQPGPHDDRGGSGRTVRVFNVYVFVNDRAEAGRRQRPPGWSGARRFTPTDSIIVSGTIAPTQYHSGVDEIFFVTDGTFEFTVGDEASTPALSFGSGYAGLNLLARFRLDMIKLDMGLIRSLGHYFAKAAFEALPLFSMQPDPTAGSLPPSEFT